MKGRNESALCSEWHELEERWPDVLEARVLTRSATESASHSNIGRFTKLDKSRWLHEMPWWHPVRMPIRHDVVMLHMSKDTRIRVSGEIGLRDDVDWD